MDVERTATTTPPPVQEPLSPDTAALRVEEQRRARDASPPDFFFLPGSQQRFFGEDRLRCDPRAATSSSSSCSRVRGPCFLCGSHHPDEVCPLRLPTTVPPGFQGVNKRDES